MGCQFRRLDQAFIAYERNTGQPHPLVLKRGHSNERRIFVPVPLTSDVDVFWTADIVVGTPGRSFSGQSPLRVTQMVVETDHSICSGRRHNDPRYVPHWPFLHDLQWKKPLQYFP